ncbi:MAG: N-acetylmuramoyl-L-alanine amidase [Bacillota bacterium]
MTWRWPGLTRLNSSLIPVIVLSVLITALGGALTVTHPARHAIELDKLFAGSLEPPAPPVEAASVATPVQPRPPARKQASLPLTSRGVPPGQPRVTPPTAEPPTTPVVPAPAPAPAPAPQPLKRLAGRHIAVDPGHGGNSGARGPAGTQEDHNVLAIGLKLRDLLVAEGAKVTMTRTTNITPRSPSRPSAGQLEARMLSANASGAQLFISLHNNWSSYSSWHGTATYYQADRGTQELATILQREIIKTTGAKDLGLFTANFHVLRNAAMPAALVEISFISNAQEEQVLLTDSYRSKAAIGLCNGIRAYFGK